jgi:hypothetical protein
LGFEVLGDSGKGILWGGIWFGPPEIQVIFQSCDEIPLFDARDCILWERWFDKSSVLGAVGGDEPSGSVVIEWVWPLVAYCWIVGTTGSEKPPVAWSARMHTRDRSAIAENFVCFTCRMRLVNVGSWIIDVSEWLISERYVNVWK